MKKLITLLIATGAFATLHAQTSRDEARRVILGQPKGNSSGSQNGRGVILGGGNNGNAYPNSYPNNYPSSSGQAQIDQVNREYDAKIWSIRNNRTLSEAEKDRAIRQLEQDRARRIQQINRNGNYGYARNEKGDHGKHLGWEKGKGNPHKYGEKPGKKKDRDDDRDDD